MSDGLALHKDNEDGMQFEDDHPVPKDTDLHPANGAGDPDKDDLDKQKYHISMPSDSGPYVTFAEFSHHQDPAIPLHVVEKHYDRYLKGYWDHFYNQFADINSNKVWFKDRYAEELGEEYAKYEHRMAKMRHTRFWEIWRTREALGKTPHLPLSLLSHGLVPHSEAASHEYVAACLELRGKLHLLESKAALTRGEVYQKIADKVTVLGIHSLFPVLTSRMIYKFAVWHYDSEFQGKVAGEWGAEAEGKTRLTPVQSNGVKIHRVNPHSVENLTEILELLNEIQAKLSAHFKLEEDEAAPSTASLPKASQLQCLALYFYYVWNLNVFTGESGTSPQEFFNRFGDVMVLESHDLTANSPSLAPESDDSKQTLRALQNWVASACPEGPATNVREKARVKLLKNVAEVSAEVFMCEYCQKFFKTREYVQNHISLKHEDELERLVEKYNARQESDALAADKYGKVFTRIEARRLHYQPLTKGDDSGPSRRGRHEGARDNYRGKY